MFFLLTDTDDNELKRKHKKIPAEQQVKMGIELLSLFNKDGYLHLLEKSDGFKIRFFSYLHHLHTLQPNSPLVTEFMSQRLVREDSRRSLRDWFFHNTTHSEFWDDVSSETREFICKDFIKNATMYTLCDITIYDFKSVLPAFPGATENDQSRCVIDSVIGRFESEQGDEQCKTMCEWLTYRNIDKLNAEQVAKLFKNRLGFYLLQNEPHMFMELRKKLKDDGFMLNYEHEEYGTYLDNILSLDMRYRDALIEECLEHLLNRLSKKNELGEKDVLKFDVIYKAWKTYQSGKKSVYSFISGFSSLKKLLNKSPQNLTLINEYYAIEKRLKKATENEATDTLTEAVDYFDALERIYNGFDSSATEPEDLKVIELEVINVCNALSDWLRSDPGELTEDQADNIITIAKNVITTCWCPDGYKVSAELQKGFSNLVDAYEHYLNLDPKRIDKLPEEAISDEKMTGYSTSYGDDDGDDDDDDDDYDYDYDDDYVSDVTNSWNNKFEPLLLKYYQNFFCERFENERYKQNLAEDPNDLLELFIEHNALFSVRFYNANERDGKMTVQHPLIRLLQDFNSLTRKGKSDISLVDLCSIVKHVTRSYEKGNLTFEQVDLIRKQIKKLKGIKSTRHTKDYVELWGYMSPKELTTHLKFKLKELKAKSKEGYYKSLFAQLEQGLIDPNTRPKSRSVLKSDTNRFFITPPMDDNNRTAVVYDNWLNEVNQFSEKTKQYRMGRSSHNNSERRLFMNYFRRKKTLSRLIPLNFKHEPEYACGLYEKVIAIFCHCAGCPVIGPSGLRKDNDKLQSWLNKNHKGIPRSRKENFINSLKEFVNCYEKDYDLVKNQGPRTTLKS
jgi:hypothetical protein